MKTNKENGRRERQRERLPTRIFIPRGLIRTFSPASPARKETENIYSRLETQLLATINPTSTLCHRAPANLSISACRGALSRRSFFSHRNQRSRLSRRDREQFVKSRLFALSTSRNFTDKFDEPVARRRRRRSSVAALIKGRVLSRERALFAFQLRPGRFRWMKHYEPIRKVQSPSPPLPVYILLIPLVHQEFDHFKTRDMFDIIPVWILCGDLLLDGCFRKSIIVFCQMYYLCISSEHGWKLYYKN